MSLLSMRPMMMVQVDGKILASPQSIKHQRQVSQVVLKEILYP